MGTMAFMVDPARVVLTGHLTASALSRALATLDLKGGVAHHLLVDATAMTGYDGAARALFVRWNREHSEDIVRLAVVTNRTLWHMVIRAMALAAGREMRAFPTPSEAESWLGDRTG